ncbi:hypothetical protein C9F11_38125 [Streptomyces sp. YIM 121038]|uniref:hypothetical protein n=1 Tax=Streptomyces sp. YIM 121038 TaxID=2136401 RepID=UPI00111030D1|nr:hypothetical protein [Streptomyces sp. YIM 121038]QCX81208.1 hypothetical protein C9F11_38125 [Streptomyces sp. YIM 121038]
MTSRVWSTTIDEHLAAAGHTGYRLRQDSHYTVRVIQDGPDPQTRLDEYAHLLQGHGYKTTLEKATDIRPLRLRVTHP